MLSLLLAACGGAVKVEFPAELPGGWKLAGTSEETDVPELVRQMGLRQALRARYQGQGEITARVFTMNVQASAFELVQKWRAAPGTIFFQSDDHFVLMEQPGADPASLSQVAKALDQKLAGR
jgi:hypothetical protein